MEMSIKLRSGSVAERVSPLEFAYPCCGSRTRPRAPDIKGCQGSLGSSIEGGPGSGRTPGDAQEVQVDQRAPGASFTELDQPTNQTQFSYRGRQMFGANFGQAPRHIGRPWAVVGLQVEDDRRAAVRLGRQIPELLDAACAVDHHLIAAGETCARPRQPCRAAVRRSMPLRQPPPRSPRCRYCAARSIRNDPSGSPLWSPSGVVTDVAPMSTTATPQGWQSASTRSLASVCLQSLTWIVGVSPDQVHGIGQGARGSRLIAAKSSCTSPSGTRVWMSARCAQSTVQSGTFAASAPRRVSRRLIPSVSSSVPTAWC